VTRPQDGRDQDRGIRTREGGAETIVMPGGKMHEALKFGEKEQGSGQESRASEAVRARESWI